MRVLLDTSVLIDHLRGRKAATRVLVDRATDGVELWSVTVVRTEILAGMHDRERQQTRRLLGTLRWQDVTLELADRAGELASRYPKSHPGIDTVDYLIAAAADLLEAELLTMNVRHFPMFPDLRAPYR